MSDRIQMEIGSESWNRLLSDGSATFGISVSSFQAEQCAVYARELIHWNRKINLTAITDPAEVAVKHFLDSIIPSRFIPANAVLLDIGSGAGFPGIPFKIMIPSLSVTLIDASRKKINFLKHIIRTLGLTHIEARHIRAEELARECKGVQPFNVIVCRALTRLNEFVEMASGMLSEDGIIVAMKGREAETDATSGHAMVFGNDTFAVDIDRYTLPYIESLRTVIRLRRQPHPSSALLP